MVEGVEMTQRLRDGIFSASSRCPTGAFIRRLGRFAGGNADWKFIAAIRTMTVSLRQAKKFLSCHKLVVALRTRDIFKIRHASLQYSDLE